MQAESWIRIPFAASDPFKETCSGLGQFQGTRNCEQGNANGLQKICFSYDYLSDSPAVDERFTFVRSNSSKFVAVEAATTSLLNTCFSDGSTGLCMPSGEKLVNTSWLQEEH